MNDNDKEKLRRQKIKDDKIFNNGYKAGEGLRDEGEYEYTQSITVNSNYSDKYLKDVYQYEETLDYNIGLTRIFKLIENDKDLKSLLHKMDNNIKLKLSKEEINWCFTKILEIMESSGESGESFYNPIYVLEALSSILNINSNDPIKDYKKIFDCLDVEIQEELVIELNKKYKFLEGKMNKRKMH
jgi:hypothetical protein